MNRVAIAFSTKDRVELSKRSILPLMSDEFDTFWIDGSVTPEGERLPYDAAYAIRNGHGGVCSNVRGGADAAIVYSLTFMLDHPNKYTHVGLVENDVLLDAGWFAPTMALFERGERDGLVAGAVSARAYQDRVLIQRDGYAVQHNSGAGMVIFTRFAAQLILEEFRNGWSSDNRRIFMTLAGIDIGRFWAFRGLKHFITADWNFEVILARYGLASLALSPNRCEMIGQVPSLADQGLAYATEPMKDRIDEAAFERFVETTARIRAGDWEAEPDNHGRYLSEEGAWTIFPHQVPAMGGSYSGAWKLKWSQGFGPFAWEARIPETSEDANEEFATLEVPVSGPCQMLVGGGKLGGTCEVIDLVSGFEMTPELQPEAVEGNLQVQVLQINMPAQISYRKIRLRVFSSGLIFYGIRSRDPQPWLANVKFDHSVLPGV